MHFFRLEAVKENWAFNIKNHYSGERYEKRP